MEALQVELCIWARVQLARLSSLGLWCSLGPKGPAPFADWPLTRYRVTRISYSCLRKSHCAKIPWLFCITKLPAVSKEDKTHKSLTTVRRDSQNLLIYSCHKVRISTGETKLTRLGCRKELTHNRGFHQWQQILSSSYLSQNSNWKGPVRVFSSLQGLGQWTQGADVGQTITSTKAGDWFRQQEENKNPTTTKKSRTWGKKKLSFKKAQFEAFERQRQLREDAKNKKPLWHVL